MRLAGAVDQYLAARRADFATTTRKDTRYILDGLAHALGPIAVRSVKRRHIEEWIGRPTRSGRDRSVASRRRDLSAARGLFDWCLENNYVKANPAAFKGPRRVIGLPRELPDDVPKLLLSCPDLRARVIVSLMAHEGLRRSEVAFQLIEETDFHSGEMLVHGKGSKERVLPISPQSVEAIHLYLMEYPVASGPLVRNYYTGRGMTPATIGKIVADVFKAAGLKQRAWDGRSGHALRHTCAGAMFDNGADARVVQETLGHSNLSATWNYLKRRSNVSAIRPFLPSYEGTG